MQEKRCARKHDRCASASRLVQVYWAFVYWTVWQNDIYE